LFESPQIAPARDRSVGLRRQITFQAMRVFSGWGYREVEIPLIDYFDSLKRGLDPDQVERSFRFVDRSGNVMMLRTDVTPAIAKVVAYQLRGSRAPLRVSYAHKVVRIERSLDRSSLESYQIGVELFGVDDLTADIEVVCIALEVMERLGLRNFQFNVTDHAIADHLLAATGAPGRIRDEVREAVEARDQDEVRRILADLGIRQRYIDAVSALANLEGGLYQLGQIEKALPDDKVLRARIERLRTFFETLSELGYERHIRLDLAELGGAAYYTGIAFNIVSEGAGRSIGRGGRYDKLVGLFGPHTSAVGFAMSSDVLVELLHPLISETSPHIDVGETVAVDVNNLVDGFEAVLERRAQNKPARVVQAGRENGDG
jgi:ATP phosphoribosyltransferase regulatory subunit